MYNPTPPQPEHQNNRQLPGGPNEIDIHEAKYDFRKSPTDLVFDFGTRPSQLPFTDHDFDRNSVPAKGKRIEWKRPGEFCGNPVMFSDGITRYDIGQGSVGTCWFLSTLAMLAERPQGRPEGCVEQRRGLFQLLFLEGCVRDKFILTGLYGEWEEVFVDDYIPVYHTGARWLPFGARSKEDPDEMWPSLLEKAFARFHGGYDDASSGVTGDAFLALTGGCAERIEFSKELAADSEVRKLALTGGCAERIEFSKELAADSEGNKMQKTMELHNRIKNAVKGDCMLTTSVPAQYNGHFGLVGGHAYSLTGACSVQDNSGRDVHLVRVRNPWGRKEWDRSQEWQTINPSVLSNITKDEGEFWMSVDDFVKYFGNVTICAMTPDFDKDGVTDTLNHCTSIYGDWEGSTAAGFQNRLDNPRYVFKVDDAGKDTDGRVPLVIQICQKMLHRKEGKAPIRVDLYKVKGGQAQCRKSALKVLGDGTNVVMYKIERQMSARRKVKPGYYVAVPSTQKPGIEKEFIVRIFSPSGLSDVSQHKG